MMGEEPTNPSPSYERGRQYYAPAPVHQNGHGAAPSSLPARNGHDPCADPQELGWFRVERRQGCAVVVASGEIDLTTAPALRDALAAASQLATRVVLDLSLVTFMDSSGLAVLFQAYKHRRRGHQISLCLGGTGRVVRRVLEITQVDTMIPTYDTLAEAVAKPT